MKRKLVLLSAAIALVGLSVSCDIGDFGESLESAFTTPLGGKHNAPEVKVSASNIEVLANEAHGDPTRALSLLEGIKDLIANATDPAEKQKLQVAAVSLAIDAVNLGGTLVDGGQDLLDAMKNEGGEDGMDKAVTLLNKLTNLPNAEATTKALQDTFASSTGNNTYDLSNLANSGIKADDMALVGITLLIADINKGGSGSIDNDRLESYGDNLIEKFTPGEEADSTALNNAALLRARMAYKGAKEDAAKIGNDAATEAIARAAAALGAFDVYKNTIFGSDDSAASAATLTAAQAVAEVADLPEGAATVIAGFVTGQVTALKAAVSSTAISQGEADNGMRIGAALISTLITDGSSLATAATAASTAVGTYQNHLGNVSATISATGTATGTATAAIYAAVYAAASKNNSDAHPHAEALANAVKDAAGASDDAKAIADAVIRYIGNDETKLGAIIGGTDIIAIASVIPTISTTVEIEGEGETDLISPELKLGLALIGASADQGNGTISTMLKDMLNDMTK
ncbi:MAG: hypothetical protein LBO67_07000 [Spirochaetaceae bacterium]|jgi:hypothetical protein|nr:hypothetical protein [Spirochaetaceae bacterium]